MSKAANLVIVLAGVFCLIHWLLPMYNQFINNATQCQAGQTYHHGKCY